MEGPPIRISLMDEAKFFIRSLPEKARNKVVFNLKRVEGGERDTELFKKLGDTKIWEFRTKFNGMAYRLFAFWDTDEQTLVVCTHGIVKKTQKTPPSEIAKAERIRRKYFSND